MSQEISVAIHGIFPDYGIEFSAEPTPVKQGKTEIITYTLITRGFRVTGVNQQRDPFNTEDELIWSIPEDGQSVIFTDINSDKKPSVFGLQIIFADSSGNQFSSMDPQVQNEGVE